MLVGWLKALSGGSAQSGGWDGWIHLHGTGYGVELQEDSTFSGYAWGSDVIGWLDFSYAQTTYQPCMSTYFCIAGGQYYRNSQCTETFQQTCRWGCNEGTCLTPPAPTTAPGNGSTDGNLRVTPFLVSPGRTTHLDWNVLYADSCSVIGSNNDKFEGLSSPLDGYESSEIVQSTTYTLYCIGEGGGLKQTAKVYIIPIWRER